MSVRTEVPPAAAPPVGPTPVRARRRRGLLPPLVVLVAVVVGWQLLTTLAHIDPTVLPGPRLVLVSTWDDRAALWPAITATSEETLLGLGLALVIAFVVGVSIDGSRVVRRSLYPLVLVSQTLPIIALAPLVVIWFGFGIRPKIVLVALFSFFPIAVGLVQGLGSVDPKTVALARTMRAGRWQMLVRVRLPGALAQVFTGLRISVTYAFTSAIVAEFVGATQGLGVYMNRAATTDVPVRTDLVFGATLVVGVLTLALFVAVGAVQRLVMPWRPPRAP